MLKLREIDALLSFLARPQQDLRIGLGIMSEVRI